MAHHNKQPKYHENNNGGFMADAPTTTNDTSQSQSNSSNSSFVGKVRSLLSTSTLSKWFHTPTASKTSQARPRTEMEADDSSNDSDDDSEDYVQQPKVVLPPAKRLKTTTTTTNLPPTVTSVSNNNNNSRLGAISSFSVGARMRNPKRLVLNRRHNSSVVQQEDGVHLSTQQQYNDSDDICGYSSMSRLSQPDKPEESTQLQEPQFNASTSTALPTSSTMINLHNRSLFDTSHDRSLFQQATNSFTCGTVSTNSTLTGGRPASLSTRRPAFSGANQLNTSNTSLSNCLTSNSNSDLLDRTMATRRIYNSPFYSGRTLYGGASNLTMGRCFNQLQGNCTPTTTNIIETKCKDRDSTDPASSTMLSSTARRILDTLESYTLDPIAKKTGSDGSSKNRRQLRQEHLFGTSSNNKPYSRTHSNAHKRLDELQVPNVAQLLKMKERLQTQTVQVRQMMQQQLQQSSTNTTNNNTNSGAAGGKMRAKVTVSLRQHKQQLDDGQSEEGLLSSIQLPISALPTFSDLHLPFHTPTVAPSTSNTTIIASTAATTTTTTTVTAITSTKPIVKLLPMSNAIAIEQDDIFVFAKPLVLFDSGLNGNRLRHIAAINNFKFSVPLNQKLVQMKPPTAATEPPRDNVDSSTVEKKAAVVVPVGFGGTFDKLPGQWECDVCLVRNSIATLTCVACTSPKTVKSTVVAPVGSTATSRDWGCMFKPPTNKWQCDVCLVSNTNDISCCVACETPKPSKPMNDTFLAAVSTVAKSSWECPSCMVRNQSTAQKCVCCETLQPGGATSKTPASTNKSSLVTKYNFGITPATATAATSSSSSSSSPNNNNNNTGFTFGIPPTKTSSEHAASTGAIAPSSSSTVAPANVDFTFGIPPPPPALAAPAATANNGSSSTVSSTTTLNQQIQQQKPLPNGVISSSSSTALVTAVTTATAATVAPPVTAATAISATALAGLKFGVVPAVTTTTTTTAPASTNLFTFGGRTPSAPTHDVSSSTSNSNSINVNANATAAACTGGSAGVSSTAVTTATITPFRSNKTTAAMSSPFGGAFSFSKPAAPPAPPAPAPTMKTVAQAAQPMFSFGTLPRTAAPPPPQQPTNGPFMFGTTISATSTSSTPSVGLFTFGAGAGAGSSSSGFSFGGAPRNNSAIAIAPQPTRMAFGGSGGSGNGNVFGAQQSTVAKMKNGGFDFSGSLGASVSKPSFAASSSGGGGGSATRGFHFAPPNALAPRAAGVTPAPGRPPVFSFGSSSSAASTGSSGPNTNASASAPFTFGAVSSSSSNNDINKQQQQHSAGAGGSAPLSFGGITSSSSSTPTPIAPHTNMFGTPTPSAGPGVDNNNSAGSGQHLMQQRRIIRKAVRRTNTQPR